MKQSEAARLLGRIERTYEHDFGAGTQEIWLEILARLDHDEATEAVEHMILAQRFVPRPADLTAALASIRGASRPDGLAAWQLVCDSIAARGWEGDHSGLPTEIFEVARQIGFQAIGMSRTDDTWMQRHFVKHYEARMERRTREQLVAPALGSGGPLGELAAGLFEPPAMETGQ